MSRLSRCQMKRWSFFILLLVIIVAAVTVRTLLDIWPMGSNEVYWLATSIHFGGKVRVDLPSAWHSRPLFRLLLYVWTCLAGQDLAQAQILMNALLVVTLSCTAILGY